MAVAFDIRERGGDQVLDVRDVRIEMEGATLLRDFDERLMRCERVGLVGPNGAGKSTLLEAIVGRRPSVAGVVRLGGSISVGYYRQDLAQVPLDRTLYDIIGDLRPLWTRGQIQGHLARFAFSGDEVQRRADTLSGGERARVALAMIMLSGANLLIFDEPTNHLDVESIEALEDAVERYPGTVLLVSHDRALLRALVTRVWVLHDQRITSFDGSFAEWEVASEERAHAATVAAQEEEALRRVREHRRTERRQSSGPDRQSTQRAAQRKAADAVPRASPRRRRRGRTSDRGARGPVCFIPLPHGVGRSVELGHRHSNGPAAPWTAPLEAWAVAADAGGEA